MKHLTLTRTITFYPISARVVRSCRHRSLTRSTLISPPTHHWQVFIQCLIVQRPMLMCGIMDNAPVSSWRQSGAPRIRRHAVLLIVFSVDPFADVSRARRRLRAQVIVLHVLCTVWNLHVALCRDVLTSCFIYVDIR